MGLLSKRVSPPLTDSCFQQGPFAPRALPRFSATTGLSVSRQDRIGGYVFPPHVARFRWLSCRASQAPRLICPRALSPTTPEGPLAALACCFTNGLSGFTLVGRLATFVFPIEAESGSLALRLTGSPPDTPVPLLQPTLARLHAEQAIYMVNSSQFTRSARLILVTDREGAGFDTGC